MQDDFFVPDEDPGEVFARFERAEKGVTAPPAAGQVATSPSFWHRSLAVARFDRDRSRRLVQA